MATPIIPEAAGVSDTRTPVVRDSSGLLQGAEQVTQTLVGGLLDKEFKDKSVAIIAEEQQAIANQATAELQGLGDGVTDEQGAALNQFQQQQLRIKQASLQNKLSATAAQTRLNTLTKEFSTRFPAFSSSFRQLNQEAQGAGTAGAGLAQIFGQREAELELASTRATLLARNAEKQQALMVQFGLNPNDPASKDALDGAIEEARHATYVTRRNNEISLANAERNKAFEERNAGARQELFDLSVDSARTSAERAALALQADRLSQETARNSLIDSSVNLSSFRLAMNNINSGISETMSMMVNQSREIEDQGGTPFTKDQYTAKLNSLFDEQIFRLQEAMVGSSSSARAQQTDYIARIEKVRENINNGLVDPVKLMEDRNKYIKAAAENAAFTDLPFLANYIAVTGERLNPEGISKLADLALSVSRIPDKGLQKALREHLGQVGGLYRDMNKFLSDTATGNSDIDTEERGTNTGADKIEAFVMQTYAPNVKANTPLMNTYFEALEARAGQVGSLRTIWGNTEFIKAAKSAELRPVYNNVIRNGLTELKSAASGLNIDRIETGPNGSLVVLDDKGRVLSAVNSPAVRQKAGEDINDKSVFGLMNFSRSNRGSDATTDDDFIQGLIGTETVIQDGIAVKVPVSKSSGIHGSYIARQILNLQLSALRVGGEHPYDPEDPLSILGIKKTVPDVEASDAE